MGEEARKEERKDNLAGLRQKSHMPSDSVFFEKVVPVLLVIMGVVMVGLVVFAAAVLFGWIQF